jgi:hypothetical protein
MGYNDKPRNQEKDMISGALKNEREGEEINAMSISYMLYNTGLLEQQKILSVKGGIIRDGASRSFRLEKS